MIPEVTGKYILTSCTLTRLSVRGLGTGAWGASSTVMAVPLLCRGGRLGDADSAFPLPAGARVLIADGYQRRVLFLATLHREGAGRGGGRGRPPGDTGGGH